MSAEQITVNDLVSKDRAHELLDLYFNKYGWTKYKIQTTKGRTESQNELSFAYYNMLARQDNQGDVNHYRAECKLRYGVPIMREDDKFCAKYDALIRGRFSYEEKLALMVEPFDFPVTRLMNKEQFSRFIGMIEAAYPRVNFNELPVTYRG